MDYLTLHPPRLYALPFFRSLLVAEDDKVTRLIVTSLLRSEGYEVVECGDGSSVYDLAISDQPDIVMLDVVMPGMDGFDALRLLRGNEETRCIPAIMLTSLPDEVGEPIGIKLGVSHYLVKPLTTDVVKLSLRSVIREVGLDAPEAPVSPPPPGTGTPGTGMPRPAARAWTSGRPGMWYPEAVTRLSTETSTITGLPSRSPYQARLTFASLSRPLLKRLSSPPMKVYIAGPMASRPS